MIRVRSILYLLFLSISVILYALPMSVLGWILPFAVVARLAQHWAQINLRALKLICRLGYRVRGLENLPSTNCIVVSKHQSTWETIALRALLTPKHTWVLKRELLWVPFFGWALAPLRPIALDRGSKLRALRQLLKDGRYWLDRGRWIVIFPEGTRVAPGEKRNYAPGAALLAQKTGYPVLPIAHNAGIFWRRRDTKKYPGTIDIGIGEPLDPAGLSSAEINQRLEEWIEGTVAKLPRKHSVSA